MQASYTGRKNLRREELQPWILPWLSRGMSGSSLFVHELFKYPHSVIPTRSPNMWSPIATMPHGPARKSTTMPSSEALAVCPPHALFCNSRNHMQSFRPTVTSILLIYETSSYVTPDFARNSITTCVTPLMSCRALVRVAILTNRTAAFPPIRGDLNG